MSEEEAAGRSAKETSLPTDRCPVCGEVMVAIRGSREAVCSNCGFKDSCCY